MKFIDLDNLKKFWSQLNLYKQDKLPDGETGQVLTKTNDGVEWNNINSYTKTEVDNKLKSKQDTLPNGSADQVLTRYSSGSNAFIWRNAVFQEDFNKSIEDLNERIDEELYVEAFVPDTNGYDYVDMGEAGIWATCNVGAGKPEEVGSMYAWGETDGRDDPYGDGYKFGDDEQNPTKYNSIDNKRTLDLEDDAAHVVMGGDWRMPTKKEYELLIELCNSSYIDNYNNSGAYGTLFTLKKNSSKQLFLPYIKKYYPAWPYQEYWTSNLYEEDLENVDYGGAFTLNTDGKTNYIESMARYYGLLIRAIIDKSSAVKSPKYITKTEAEDTYEHKLPEGTEGQVLTKTNDGVVWADAKGGSGIELPDGEPGQILTKTSDSIEWKDINSYTKSEVDNKLKSKQDTLPNGTAGQVLTKTINSIKWEDPAKCEDLTDEEIKDIFGLSAKFKLNYWNSASPSLGPLDVEFFDTEMAKYFYKKLPIRFEESNELILDDIEGMPKLIDNLNDYIGDEGESMLIVVRYFSWNSSYKLMFWPSVEDWDETCVIGIVKSDRNLQTEFRDIGSIELYYDSTENFVSGNNFKQIWANEIYPLIDNKQDKLPTDGNTGQFLSKTEDGVEWQNIPEGLTNEDVENAIDEALYESVPDKQPKFQPRLPEGKSGQVLTKTDDGLSWTNVEYGDNMVLQRIDIDGYNALAATDNLDRNTLYLITGHKTA